MSDVLVLASASPRRRELLTAAGIAHVVDAADVDETPLPDEPPRDHVERLARLKAGTVAARHPGAIVLGADTIVVLDGQILGKPRDARDARRMLELLSGRTHDVLTAVAIARNGRVRSGVEATSVAMRDISAAEIAAYVDTGEPLDKAGAYAIQGGAARFVSRISGAFDTVVGLPVEAVRRLLTLAAGSYPDE